MTEEKKTEEVPKKKLYRGDHGHFISPKKAEENQIGEAIKTWDKPEEPPTFHELGAQKQVYVPWTSIFFAIAISLGLGLIVGLNAGHLSGFAEGHSQGLAEQQDTIWGQGFEKGQEFQRNWTYAPYYLQPWDRSKGAICEKANATHCITVDNEMNQLEDISYMNRWYDYNWTWSLPSTPVVPTPAIPDNKNTTYIAVSSNLTHFTTVSECKGWRPGATGIAMIKYDNGSIAIYCPDLPDPIPFTAGGS